MDLAQAEALSAMISAQSAKAFSISLAQLKGSLGHEIDRLRRLLIDALAGLDAAIDFTDDVAENETPSVLPQISEAAAAIDRLLSTYGQARIFTEGISCVITGKPNVGKSSLLNTLAGKKKAIVTDIPGTTRDLITETITLNGLCVHLTDTAGIRAPQGIIEKEGIDLVWEQLEKADVIVILLDCSRPLTDEDRHILEQNKIRADKVVLACNKSDLPRAWPSDNIADAFSPGVPRLHISAKFGDGLSDLKQSIVQVAGADNIPAEAGMISQLRHKLALEKTLACLTAAEENLRTGRSPEFTACELREAVDALDEITGQKIGDDVLDKIFSSFCIGK
jgi:tRNA modification GTPase